MEWMETICLVSCVGAKGAAPAPAKDLYQSDWFTKARAYAEASGSQWFILSGKYDLVHPDDLISPYEQTLNTMGISERRKWANLVQKHRARTKGKPSEVQWWWNHWRWSWEWVTAG